MKKIILFTITILCFALDIDIKSLEKNVKSHPNDLQNRLIIASYYIKHNNLPLAQKYINYVLKKDPKNKNALALKNKINAIFFNEEIKKKYKTLNNAISTIYEKENYKKLLKIYKQISKFKQDNKISEENKIKIARVAMWEGDYTLSLNILKTLKNKKTLDYYEIKAYNLYYMGKYKEAKKYFQILFHTTGKTEYAEKLLNIYFYLGDIDSAEKLLLSLKRTHPKLAKKYEQKILELKHRQLKQLEEKYKQNPTFQNLQSLTYLLFQTSPREAIDLVKNYIKLNPSDKKAKIFLAKLLSWSGNNEEAIKYLSEFQNTNDMEAKLLFGKILAWQGDYNKALLFLSDVYDHGNEKQKYEAKKMLGFIAMWQGKNIKAKQIFTSLLKQNPKDEEVIEALMVLNKNVKPLITKYQKLLKKNPNNEEYILKLADYYYMIKNYDKSAYYYEKYLKLHPEKIEIYKTLGDIYLQLKNYYKGFGNLEYYASYKNTKEAYLDLAYRYYWNGFNKEALKVLDDLLKKYPNFQDALILKAKILKINPRFVNSSTAATIDEYYAKRSEKILALADRAYFANLYKSAADYYKEYLFLKPNDYDVREKYAYALEASKEYAKAAGEFYLLMWYKKTPLIEYHYAFNLQKSGQSEKAKKIYQKLLQNVPKPLPGFLKKFLNNWKQAWESMNFAKYASYYDKSISEKLYWRLKKQSIFKKASFISVGIYDPVLIEKKDNIYKIKFFQVYASKIKKDKGYKTLEIKCNQSNCKIIKETWTPGAYTPYNPNNSLEKYIKDNLNELNNTKKTEVKLISKKKHTPINNINKKTNNAINQDIKKKDIILSADLKLEPQNEKKALDYLYLKKEKATKSNVIQQDLKESAVPLFDWQLFGYINYFKDNQNTKMWTRYISISKRINTFVPFLFFKNYDLSQTSNKNGFLYGLGIKKKPFLFDVFLDKSGLNTLGWDIEYYPYFLKGITLRLNKHNMVYSRKTICSSNHTKIKLEATGYKVIKKPKELWWSIAYEKVDDGNNVLTPQLEYDIKNFSYKSIPIIFYFSGWYQFNSKQTDCYYSPDKTDTNILGLKVIYPYKKVKIKFKGGIGYSFFDKTYVYKLGLWGSTINVDKIEAKLGCEYSNTSALNQSSNYKSFECEISARKWW
ncbi:tetratricopeptide repeat protein [Nautilia lithotrophica]